MRPWGGGAGRVRVLALTTPQKLLPTVILNLFQNLTRVKNKLSTKTTTFLQSHALSRLVGGLAALFAVFFMLFTPAFSAETFNIADYTKPEYGSGDGEKYYKWENTENGLQLTETDKQNAQITAKYDTGTTHTRIENENTDCSSTNITGGSFVNQTTGSTSGNQYGGAIYNYSSAAPTKMGDIEADFIGNYVDYFSYMSGGGAIGNLADPYHSTSEIGNIKGNFIGNYVTTSSVALGGAIAIFCVDLTSQIGNITGDFIGNYASGNSGYGGAICNLGIIGNINGNFIGNYAFSTVDSASGGAIYNENGQIGAITGSFINNYAQTTSETALALGGAIYTTENLTITANNQPIEFTGNYTEDSRGKTPNAIFVNTSSSTPESPVTITLSATNNGSITLNDQIDGGKPSGTTINRSNQYNLSLTGDKTGKITLNNDVINANITSENINLTLGKNTALENSSLTINSGSLSFINNIAEPQFIQSTHINGNINLAVDVNLATSTMDTLPNNTTVAPSAQINITTLNLLNDSPQNKTTIPFAPPEYAQNVTYSGPSPIAYSPLYKYNVSYNPEDGFFTFMRGASSSSNPSDNYNPAALTSPVTTQAGAYSTQLQTFNYAFQHSDNFMNLPYLERLTLKSQNKYALSPTSDPTDVGTFSPLFTKEENAGLWLKPYASFESIPLNNGPKVSNINYGTLIGHDSELTPIKHNFDRVLTSYIGYNGASQRFNGVDAYQNGALIGSTITLYKNNFFNATTTSIGASTGSSTNMYGSEHYSMLLAGIANKAGYNLEFKNGKIILQPSLLISYTFVNTFDYNNSAGLRIKSDPLHAIQLAPGIKLIANTNSGWQPYLAISMIWNILDKTNVKANDTRLPEMSIDPYLQYGLGLQKPLKNNYLAYAQAMIHSGGRNGISLSAGLRWKIGKNK